MWDWTDEHMTWGAYVVVVIIFALLNAVINSLKK